MLRRSHVFSVAVVLAVLAFPAHQTVARELSWDCSAGAITLRIGERSIPVMRSSSARCRELKPSEYHLHDMPDTVLTAVVALRDGVGDELFITTDGASLIVHHRHVMRAEPIAPYREIKRVPMQRTTSNEAMQLTASKPAVCVSGVCRRARMLRSMHGGLAAADLVSR